MYEDARNHFRSHDPALYEASRSVELDEIVPSDDLFRDVIWTITGQQLSSVAANAIFSRFERLFPGRPFDALGVLALPEETLRSVGLSGAKVRTIRSFAQAVKERTLDLPSLVHAADAAVMATLTGVKGIGPWTAEMVLMFSLGRSDVFSPGDLGLRRGIQLLYGLDDHPSRERMADFASAWSPFRTYAARILWKVSDEGKDRVARSRPRAW